MDSLPPVGCRCLMVAEVKRWKGWNRGMIIGDDKGEEESRLGRAAMVEARWGDEDEDRRMDGRKEGR